MKAAQVNNAIGKIGLGMSPLSRLLKTGRSTIYRWKEDGTDGCNAIVLRLLESGKITVEDVEKVQD